MAIQTIEAMTPNARSKGSEFPMSSLLLPLCCSLHEIIHKRLFDKMDSVVKGREGCSWWELNTSALKYFLDSAFAKCHATSNKR